MNRLSIVLSIFLGVIIGLFACAGQAAAEGGSGPYVPPGLEPWKRWVLEKDPQESCTLKVDQKVCVWPGRLDLSLSSTGGTFKYSVWLDRHESVSLPGGKDTFPFDVTVQGDGKAAPGAVFEGENGVIIDLDRGAHTISGNFRWTTLPKSLLIPTEVANVSLEISGRRIGFPKISGDGALWLEEGDREEKKAENALKVDVFRRVVDGIPFQIDTLLRLRVSGVTRDVTLGQVLPAGGEPILINSSLGYKLDDQKHLTLQLKPGTHEVTIETLYPSPPAELHAVDLSLSGWPEQEIWVWQPNEMLRSVEIHDAVSIEPDRTTIPDGWKGLSTFVVQKGGLISFKETRRGIPDEGQNLLSLSRRLWLDFDGKGFSVQDMFSGTMNKGWRINADAGLSVGRALVDGSDQLITADPDSNKEGIEIRKQAVSLSADGRIENGTTIPAIGWSADVQSLSASLLLPPGWLLIDASGVDQISNSWLGSWTLLDIFIIVLIAVSVGKLFGTRWALVAALYLILSHDIQGAPQHSWFQLLGAYALMRYLPDGKLRSFSRFHFGATFVLLSIVMIAFVFSQFTNALFPDVGDSSVLRLGIFSPLFFLAEESLLGWLVLSGIIWLVGSQFTGEIRIGRIILVGVGAIAFLILFGGLIFSGLMSPASRISEFAMQPQSMSAPGGAGTGSVYDMRRDYAASNERSLSDSYLMKEEKSLGIAGEAEYRKRKQAMQQVDPNATVQTGQGIPTWNWSSYALSWNGAVKEGHSFSLFLLSPFHNLILSLLRIGGAILLMFIFLQSAWKVSFRFLPLALLSILLFGASPRVAEAQDFPSQQILKELEERLTRDRCKNDCASVNSASYRVGEREAELELVVSSDGTASVALPGPMDQILPRRITVDGVETSALRRDELGFQWVRVESGVHHVKVSADLVRPDIATLQFPTTPLVVSVDAPLWSVDGVGPQGFVEGSLQLSRKLAKDSRQDEEAYRDVELPNWYIVERSIEVGLPWQITTTVQRLGSSGRASLVKVPLLKGESVSSDTVKVEAGVAMVQFGREATSVSWESSFAEEPEFSLSTDKDSALSEVWDLRCSSIWRCKVSGITPVQTLSEGESAYNWKPFPGDSVTVTVGKPTGVPGRSVTVDNVTYDVRPGERLVTLGLQMTIRSSRGGFQEVKIPSDATVQQLQIDNVVQSVRNDGGTLALPLKPGATLFNLELELPRAISNVFRVPSITVGDHVANAVTTIAVPSGRWVLFAFGPGMGPAVLFWGKVLGLIVLALILTRSRMTPLGFKSWLLLGLGTATLSAEAIVIPILWLIILHIRKTNAPQRTFQFNLFQIFVALFTLLSLTVLFEAIRNGLVVSPDMAIVGNDSTNFLLRWYVDFTGGALPTPVLISVPIWVWRVVMLAWSSWLVFALLSWLKWGFGCFSEGGIWKARSQTPVETGPV